MYVEYKECFNKEYETWVIAFCPDTAEFFATNKRGFFWQLNREFNTEKEAVNYFESHVLDFISIQNDIMKEIIYGYNFNDYVWLDNTSKKYYL